jgi:transposase
VIWKFRSGAPWRDLPERFGAWKNIHTRFSRWSESGVWESLFKALADDPDNEYVMIDATILRAHQHSAGAQKKDGCYQAIGRSRGGLTTKIHVVVDALENQLKVSLTKGQVHDITQAEPLTANIRPGAMLADKGYDADSFIQSLEMRSIAVVTPPKSNRKVQRDCDYALYAQRNLVERFFNNIKHFRGIATRYEKTARNFLAGLDLPGKSGGTICRLVHLSHFGFESDGRFVAQS